MESIVKFLPLIFSLMAQGGEIAKIIGLVVEALSRAQALLPQAPAPKVLDVKWLQQKLTDLGFSPGAIDGQYGELTKKAVSAYQAARGLTVDGWAGVATMAALVAEQ